MPQTRGWSQLTLVEKLFYGILASALFLVVMPKSMVVLIPHFATDWLVAHWWLGILGLIALYAITGGGKPVKSGAKLWLAAAIGTASLMLLVLDAYVFVSTLL